MTACYTGRAFPKQPFFCSGGLFSRRSNSGEEDDRRITKMFGRMHIASHAEADGEGRVASQKSVTRHALS